MPYSVEKTALDSVLLLQPKVFSDPRGFFFESFNQRRFEELTGLAPQFVQDNHSRSTAGTLRGNAGMPETGEIGLPAAGNTGGGGGKGAGPDSSRP